MKINELLKPNEGFNLNEAQVAGSTSPAARSEQLLGISPHRDCPPPPISSLSQPVGSPSVFTHAFPGVIESPGLADGNVPFSSVFLAAGNMGN